MASSEIECLEHPTFKVPYELLNKKFRTTQKLLDRDVAGINVTTKELTSLAFKEDATVEEATKVLDSLSQKINNLKAKSSEWENEEESLAEELCGRVSYVKSFASGDMNDQAQRVWKKQREDRILIDHLFRTGNYKTALVLTKDADLEHLVDVELFRMAQSVEDALLSHNTAPCLAWCQENKSKLKRIKSCLEFRVRLQDFIEMIKKDKRMEAIRYARKYFATVDPDLLNECQEALALLAFSVTTTCLKYKNLFSDDRWTELVELFRTENFALHQLNQHSLLSASLKAGLSALKTPQCYSKETYNMQCPVCSKGFNSLAENLPFSYHAQSQLICTMSGDPINEHNPPLVLPNGYVYGEKALKEMATMNNGNVTCSRTKETFNFADAKKVFVM